MKKQYKDRESYYGFSWFDIALNTYEHSLNLRNSVCEKCDSYVGPYTVHIIKITTIACPTVAREGRLY